MSTKLHGGVEYFVPVGAIGAETEEKKSRFLTTISNISSKEEAVLFFQQVRLTYPTANHNCTVFIVGNPKCALDQGWDDDGEPSGTAGKPMLNVLQHNNIGNVALVVTRYFGGTKLGTGGLVRAYSAAVKAVLEVVTLEEYCSTTSVEISFHYQFETAIRNMIKEFAGTLRNAKYSTLVTLEIELAEQKSQDFYIRVLNQTKGSATFIDSPDIF